VLDEPVHATTAKRSEGMKRVLSCFDLRSGIGGAAVMSVLVLCLNASHGVWPAATAALKQAAYTFLFGGLIVRLCKSLATRRRVAARLRMALATAIPSVITIVLVYAVHSLEGTPEPLLSTVPAAVLGPPSFAVFARRAGGPGSAMSIAHRHPSSAAMRSDTPHGENAPSG
jgi:hypothetical protein